MSRDKATTKLAEGAGVRRDADEGHAEAASAFDLTFRYALVVYAFIEFIAVALFVYYKLSR
jgi:hypothetical protein